ncbi:MAG: hypothetical protein EOP84_07740 [Verrucomicrobiaceae bacterium]|nr:MAG: hypothetical protein EOP84_07740 [Verrucomicrobiaceae bacterium]
MRPVVPLEVIQKADALHRSGLEWKDVAARLGVKRSTITALTNRYRRGSLNGMESRQRIDDHEEFFLPLVEQGKSLKEIADAWGVKRTTAYERMAHRGYDSEIRRAIAQGVAP